VFTGVLVGLVALLLIGAGVLAFVLASRHNNDGSPGSTASSSPTVSAAAPTPTGHPQNTSTADSGNQVIDIHCNQIIGKQYDTVRGQLEDLDLGVERVDVADGGKSGQVVDATPCQARPGDTITLKVSTGKGGGDGSGGGNGGSGPTGRPTPSADSTCKIGGPIGNCSPDPRQSQ
jgi:hypothetical protein